MTRLGQQLAPGKPKHAAVSQAETTRDCVVEKASWCSVDSWLKVSLSDVFEDKHSKKTISFFSLSSFFHFAWQLRVKAVSECERGGSASTSLCLRLAKQPPQVAGVWEGLVCWGAWDTACGHKIQDIAPSTVWKRKSGWAMQWKNGDSSSDGRKKQCEVSREPIRTELLALALARHSSVTEQNVLVLGRGNKDSSATNEMCWAAVRF